MSKIGVAIILTLAVFAFADDDEVSFTYDNDVMVLDESNFQQARDKFEYLFLEFYAPWCGHW